MKWFYLLIFLLSFTQVVLAADSTFKVRMLIGEDTTPPTIPTNLLALPISTSQIDLSWTASTDNYQIGGYQVWRDSVQLATTTLTNYSDAGLTASTTYSYYVVAFDNALNYSASSTVVSTSTLPVVATTTPTTTPTTVDNGSVQSSKSPFNFSNLKVTTTETTANINFDTNLYAKVTWRWGRTINYELGYVASNLYQQKHNTILTELSPGTVYELEIILTRRISGENYIERVRFETKSPADNLQPPNVSNLSAKLLDSGEVMLDWKNPDIEDLAYVRVIGNDYFYPLDRTDGWFIYEGKDQQVIDERKLKNQRFYTVFVYDKAGNRSSGAVTYIGTSAINIDEPVKQPDLVFDPYADFDFSKLEVYQNRQLLPQFNDTITIDRKGDITFKIPYDVLPENLKTVILTLTDPLDESKTISFLLVINANRSAYEASISSLPQLGYYKTTINIYDYSAKVVSRKSGGIIVSDGYFEDKATRVIEEMRLLVNWPLIFTLLSMSLVLFSLVFWRLFVRR